MSDWMKKIYFIFIVLIALLAAEEKNISISANGIENLIKID
jgi:type IV secretory pathway VirB2 component (pilin)